ncbi:MAG: bacterial regulatory helix-turn-helix protein LysR family protein 97 [Rhizobacter sp.]|nr:bacterial regulatory helix-turn-helix protein LysR family protein 97 [Rhizobacter sp.]
MKLSQLRALTAIADSGTVNRAATQLNLTHSAVSKSVKELESELGVPLLKRTASGMALTAYGLLVIKRGRLIHAEVGRIRQDVDAFSGQHRGRLSIGVTPVTANAGIADCIINLRRRSPDLALTVLEERPQRLCSMLREGTLDIAVSSELPRDADGCEAMRIRSITSFISVRKGHPARHAKRLADLMDCEWATLDPIDDESSTLVRCFESQGLPLPAKITRCASIGVYLELARRMEVVTLWSSLANSYESLNAILEPVELALPLPERQLCVVYLDAELLTEVAREAVKEIVSAMRSGAA